MPALAAAMLAAVTGAAGAHPHILADVQAELRFDAHERIESVRSEWVFDPAFSAFAVTGLDANLNGVLEPIELQALAQLHVESLADHGFLTHLVVDGIRQRLVPPTDYGFVHDGLHLTLFFVTPLERPVAIGRDAAIQVFDPDYFVGFAFATAEHLMLRDAPPGCAASHHPPRGVDAATMAALVALPASQRALPPDLATFAGNLADTLTIACPTRVERQAPPPAGARSPAVRRLFDLPVEHR